ncbi:putative cytochrome P450 94B3-like [Iris pallida]|uniref:noroxomaritidine synthase n=1 Tax=Iris pallida TaxID=29817 RepID=A0AAX6EU10_IRIPA|nr:putative cytochrome P450 94B3-like [Iris pallida]
MEDFNNLLCSSFFLLLLSFPVVFFFFFYIIKKKKIRCSSSSNNKQGSVVNFYEIVKNGHRFLDWSTERLQASATHTVTLPGIVLTTSPSNVEHVIKTNFRNYPKGPRSIATLEDLLGRGIFNSDGDHWRTQRKLASPGFNTKTIRTFLLDAVRSEVADRLLPFLSAAGAESAVVDLQDVLERFAFDNVCKVAFDVDPGRLSSRGGSGEGDAFACSYEAATAIVMGRFKTPRLLWSLRRLLGLGRERALKRELAVLKDFAAKVVNEKRRDHAIGTGGGRDLLSMVMAEGDFSDEFLRDLVLNYVLAGRDTTSSAMSWFFWLVSSRPEVERRIVGETESVRARHGSSAGSMFTLEELREMSYLHAALSEAMRLYPPVALETRYCAEGDVLPDGTEVGKGVIVMHSPYAMGRMESLWGEDCGEFRPERWLDPDGVFQPRSPYEYPVFHGGPRMCLGKDMAYIQMKAVVASVMERFVVDVVVEEEEREREPEPELVVVLRMKKGLPVRIIAR